MSEYEVPKEMHEAAVRAWAKGSPETSIGDCLREIELAVIRWISENPPVPTGRQMKKLYTATEHEPKFSIRWVSDLLTEWYRICWLKPEPEVPEEVKELLPEIDKVRMDYGMERLTSLVLAIYRRGEKKGKEQS